MKKIHGSQRYTYNSDMFFPYLLFITLTLSVALASYQIFFVDNLTDSYNDQVLKKLLPTTSVLAAGVTIWTVFLFGVRIWFACLYKSYSPVSGKELPVITVIIPAYNEGPQVLDTVRSVMDSNYPAEKMQVICVDDGSKDDTWEWMKKAKDEFPHRVKLIRQPFNSGKRLALREGFANAKGKIFVTIDSDSEILPDTLRHLVSPFVLDHRVGAVAGNVRVLNTSEGFIPKMFEISFAYAFDFLRSGQSVYGGVFCTPGALSAYRADVVRPNLSRWVNQTFMGKRATIGEDRALTNMILGMGFRVVYQRKAIVNTKIPVTYTGLRKMLLRWARSNVRENLVMFSFVARKFRPNDSGSNWIRLFSVTQILRLTFGEGCKLAVVVQLLLNPIPTLILISIGCLISAIMPSIVYQKQYHSLLGWQWALPFSFYWIFSLSWISLWGLISANRTGWLTREIVIVPDPQKHAEVQHHHRLRRLLSKAA